MDNTTDDLLAWNATVAAFISSGSIQIPVNATSRVSNTVVLPLNKAIIISGSGRTSALCGTGIAIIQLTAAGQSLQNMKVCDPTGSSSTVGVQIYGGTAGSPDANQISMYNVLVEGNPSNKLGVGIQLQSTVNIVLDTVTEAYFFEGLNSIGSNFNTTTRLSKSNLLSNGDLGWNISTIGPSDVSATECDFEGNTTAGILSNAQNTAVNTSHFESNGINVHVASGEFFGSGNTYAGGSVLVDSGAIFTSYNEQMSGITLTNNSTGGGSAGFAGATIIYSLLGPTINTASTGWTQRISRSEGFANVCYSSTVLTPCPLPYTLTGAPSYSVDRTISTTGLIISGATATLSGSTTCGGSTPTITGGSTAGTFPAGVSGTCTAQIVLPAPPLPATRWICGGSDTATATNMPMFAGSTATTCNIKGTTTSGDTISFWAIAIP